MLKPGHGGMILRSGLIQNRPGVDAAHFAAHWRERHGPLALKVPNLKGYAQNLVSRRVVKGDVGLHPVDGISQLWFDDFEAMSEGTASPEQQACIDDISGFLAGVTLAIQKPGAWRRGASRRGFKTIFIFAGDRDPAEVEALFGEVIAGAKEVVDYRLNPIAVRDIIVDETVANSAVPIVGLAEAWFATDDARNRGIDDVIDAGSLVVAAAVAETILRPIK